MRVTPTRPLPAACHWNVEHDRAHLQWNYGCIGYVVPDGDRFRTVIQWQQRIHEAPAGSLAQGMRWIERWIEARHGGFPGGGKVRWWERLQSPDSSRIPR